MSRSAMLKAMPGKSYKFGELKRARSRPSIIYCVLSAEARVQSPHEAHWSCCKNGGELKLQYIFLVLFQLTGVASFLCKEIYVNFKTLQKKPSVQLAKVPPYFY